MVELGGVQQASDAETVRELLEKHFELTGSSVARRILDDWAQELKKFVCVMPYEYKRVLEQVETQPLKAEADVSDG
jgi:glutamate synthase (NADPH/NADH) large chain